MSTAHHAATSSRATCLHRRRPTVVRGVHLDEPEDSSTAAATWPLRPARPRRVPGERGSHSRPGGTHHGQRRRQGRAQLSAARPAAYWRGDFVLATLLAAVQRSDCSGVGRLTAGLGQLGPGGQGLDQIAWCSADKMDGCSVRWWCAGGCASGSIGGQSLVGRSAGRLVRQFVGPPLRPVRGAGRQAYMDGGRRETTRGVPWIDLMTAETASSTRRRRGVGGITNKDWKRRRTTDNPRHGGRARRV